jgi:hypothetical protein
VIFTKENLKMICKMEMEKCIILIKMNMKGNGRIIKKMGKDF